MDINDLFIFVKVAQAGSFSKAGQLLGMPVSTVSRRVAQLEEALGVPLLYRTTRSLKVTDVGKSYLEHGQVVAAELEKVQALAANLQAIPQGTLRLTATTDFGNQFLGEIVEGYLRANPKVQVDILLTERVVDLVGEGMDLAIRIGELMDSSHVARKIGSIEMQLYASPEFIKKNGEPKSPRELNDYECIVFTGRREGAKWQLRSEKRETTIGVSGRILCNNVAMIRSFAVAGRGISLMPHFFCVDEVKDGKLKVVLPEWSLYGGPIHVVYPSQRFQLPRVKAFVDHLVRACDEVPWKYR